MISIKYLLVCFVKYLFASLIKYLSFLNILCRERLHLRCPICWMIAIVSLYRRTLSVRRSVYYYYYCWVVLQQWCILVTVADSVMSRFNEQKYISIRLISCIHGIDGIRALRPNRLWFRFIGGGAEMGKTCAVPVGTWLLRYKLQSTTKDEVVLGWLFGVCKIGPTRLNPILAGRLEICKIPSLPASDW